MTRIYTLSFEDRNDRRPSYLVILMAHRDGRRAVRAARAEAGRHPGAWRLAHLAQRRTSLAVPPGEILGLAGPFTYDLEEP